MSMYLPNCGQEKIAFKAAVGNVDVLSRGVFPGADWFGIVPHTLEETFQPVRFPGLAPETIPCILRCGDRVPLLMKWFNTDHPRFMGKASFVRLEPGDSCG